MNQTNVLNSAGYPLYNSITYADGNNPYSPSQVTDALNHTWNYTYEPYGGRLASVTTPYDVKTTYSYDTSLNSLFGYGLLNQVQMSWYDSSLQSTAITATLATYIYCGEQASPTSGPLGTLSSITLLPPSSPYFVAYSPTYEYWYDSMGNVTKVTAPAATRLPASTDYSYDTTTTTLSYTTDGSSSIQNEAIGEPGAITNSLGKTWHYRYDALGHPSSSWDPYGKQRTYGYNYLDQLEKITFQHTGDTGSGSSYIFWPRCFYGGPIAQTFIYDESGNLTRKIYYTYGAEGETLSAGVDTADATAVTYDSLYRAVAVGDANGHATSYNYYPSGSTYGGYLQSVVRPGGDTTTFDSYDILGRLTQRTDARGTISQYQYDGLSGTALSALNFPAYPSQNLFYSYDGAGRLSSTVDGTGASITNHYFPYNPASDLYSVDYSAGTGPSMSVDYYYYPDGSRWAMGLRKTSDIPFNSSELRFHYWYDSESRVTKLVNTSGEETDWGYYDNNSLGHQLAYNGAAGSSTLITHSEYGYNPVEAPYEIDWFDGSGSALSRNSSIVHDDEGRIKSLTRQAPYITTGPESYSYNSKGQLTAESTAAGSYSYNYDATGNPTFFRTTTPTYSYNADDQVQGTGLTYDATGNAQRYPTGSGTVSYDVFNRPTQFTNSGTSTSLFNGYYPDGLRASRHPSNGRTEIPTTYYLYDGSQPVAEYSASGSITAVNTYGVAGLVSRHSGTTSQFYTFDARGNTSEVLDNTGALLGSYATDAYGGVTTTHGLTPAQTSPFVCQGAQWGAYSDLDFTPFVLMGHRYYDPGTGRWLTRDPIGTAGGLNLYAYCGGDPVNFSDPSGLQAAEEVTEEEIEPEPAPGAFVPGVSWIDVDSPAYRIEQIERNVGPEIVENLHESLRPEGIDPGAPPEETPPQMLARLRARFNELAEKHLLPKYRAIDPDLKAGITGSFEKGTVGNPNKETFGQPIDLSSFDIDYWIESDACRNEFGGKLKEEPEFRSILEGEPGFEGLRPGRKGFTIKFKSSSE